MHRLGKLARLKREIPARLFCAAPENCPGSARASRASDRALAVGTHARHRASLYSPSSNTRNHRIKPNPTRLPRQTQISGLRLQISAFRRQGQLAAPKRSEGGSRLVKIRFFNQPRKLLQSSN